MTDAQLAELAKSLIDDLARAPRFAGSPEEALARARCRAELERAGFSCREIPFTYSLWLGKWGTPLVSLALALLFTALSRIAIAYPLVSTVAAVGTILAAARLNPRAVHRGWILGCPFSRALAANLEARRGEPRVWLIAHLDSKSQTVPMLLRIAGSVVLQAAGLLVVLGAAIVHDWENIATPVLEAVPLIALIGALPAVLCFIGNESPGAVDNASGVAAVLMAAQSSTSPAALGVLITSGEELGLAGARAWANSAPAHATIVNCDTIDEAGTYRCMYNDSEPMRITVAAENESKRLGIPLRVGRLIPGIMADSMVFAQRSNWSGVTISRGTLRTLARIHTARDTSARLTGDGVAKASRLLSAIARDLS